MLRSRSEIWLPPMLLSAILVAVAQYDFLTFHTLAEFFTIFIAFMLFALAWNTVQFYNNYLLVFLACGYFWIANLDLMQIMAHPNMNLIIDGSENLVTQFWLVSSFMEAMLLLLGVWLVHKSIYYKQLFFSFGFTTLLVISLIVFGYFPDGYIDGVGLSSFKSQSKYLIIVILFVALYFYIAKVKFNSDNTKNFLIASIVFTIAYELLSTTYVISDSFLNIAAHVFKVFSYWMLYQSMVSRAVVAPNSIAHTLGAAIIHSPLGINIINFNGENNIANIAYKSTLKPPFVVATDSGHKEIKSLKSWLEIDGVCEALTKGEIWRARIIGERNGEPAIEKVMISPVFDYNKSVNAASIIVTDITSLEQARSIITDEKSAISEILVGSITAIAELFETRDPYTSGHSKRVSEIAVSIGKELNLTVEELEGIRIAGLIHDIGKIKVPMEILNKPGKISDSEFNIIKEHPKIGYSVIKNIPFPWNVPEIVLSHHERWQGTGYPNQLAGDDIPFGARILAVADMLESVAAHRPYRPSLGIKKAFEILEKGSGIDFDPVVAKATLSIREELTEQLINAFPEEAHKKVLVM